MSVVFKVLSTLYIIVSDDHQQMPSSRFEILIWEVPYIPQLNCDAEYAVLLSLQLKYIKYSPQQVQTVPDR